MKYALCNELFGKTDLETAAAISKKAGYSGIEFAPFTVFGFFSPAYIKLGIENIRKALSRHELTFVGFHWLLVDSRPDARPMSLVSPDRVLRDAALDRLELLLTASGELGGGVWVLGSPKQRNIVPGQSAVEAAAMFRDGVFSLRGLCGKLQFNTAC
jgi:sugar phosphate isomerase/epimerase